MRVLFLHDNFPAHFRDLAPALAMNPDNEVVFGTHDQPHTRSRPFPNGRKVFYRPLRPIPDETHSYIRSVDRAVANGQGAYQLMEHARKQGFVPDIVVAHSGWGPGLYAKDAFPDAKVLSYFEWYYHPHGSNNGFLPDDEVTADTACQLRTRNIPILLDLAHCDYGITSTNWTLSQFPRPFRDKIVRLHEGINTDYWSPEPVGPLNIAGRDLSGATEYVTYAVRGLEPYRGFPTFMSMLEKLLPERPGLHAIVIGDDRVSYGKNPTDGTTWMQHELARVNIDESRVHFTGSLGQSELRRVLRSSSVHTHMTIPFLPSWSLFEAMSTGCLVAASDVAVCRELIDHGENGFLIDFFDADAWAAQLNDLLDRADETAPIREAARQTILDNYDLVDLLPQQIKLLDDIINERVPDNLAPTIDLGELEGAR